MATTSTIYQHNDYWKLSSYQCHTVKEMKDLLNERHYFAGSAKGRERLSECLRRSDLGLISYVNSSNKDLRRLIEARDIDTSNVLEGIRVGQRQHLISLLEAADDRPRFRKFARLPPELRNRVYDFYFAGFEDKPIYAPTQPPLTMTCRKIRIETLQMFYSRCTFAILFHIPVRKYPPPARTLLQVPNQLLLFLHTTPAKNIALIRKLRFSIDSSPLYSGGMPRAFDVAPKPMAFDLKIQQGKNGVQAVALEMSNMADWSDFNHHRIEIEHEVRKVVAKIHHRAGKKSVTVDDILSFRKAMESY